MARLIAPSSNGHRRVRTRIDREIDNFEFLTTFVGKFAETIWHRIFSKMTNLCEKVKSNDCLDNS
jgi:hypothetical protein